MNAVSTSAAMRLAPLKVSGADNSASGSIKIICRGTGERLPWNEAARAGWVADLNGPAFNAYYSPEAIRLRREGAR